MEIKMKAWMLILPAGIGENWTLVTEDAVRNPFTGLPGALVKHVITGNYAMHSAGAISTCPRKWAAAIDAAQKAAE